MFIDLSSFFGSETAPARDQRDTGRQNRTEQSIDFADLLSSSKQYDSAEDTHLIKHGMAKWRHEKIEDSTLDIDRQRDPIARPDAPSGRQRQPGPEGIGDHPAEGSTVEYMPLPAMPAPPDGPGIGERFGRSNPPVRPIPNQYPAEQVMKDRDDYDLTGRHRPIANLTFGAPVAEKMPLVPSTDNSDRPNIDPASLGTITRESVFLDPRFDAWAPRADRSTDPMPVPSVSGLSSFNNPSTVDSSNPETLPLSSVATGPRQLPSYPLLVAHPATVGLPETGRDPLLSTTSLVKPVSMATGRGPVVESQDPAAANRHWRVNADHASVNRNPASPERIRELLPAPFRLNNSSGGDPVPKLPTGGRMASSTSQVLPGNAQSDSPISTQLVWSHPPIRPTIAFSAANLEPAPRIQTISDQLPPTLRPIIADVGMRNTPVELPRGATVTPIGRPVTTASNLQSLNDRARPEIPLQPAPPASDHTDGAQMREPRLQPRVTAHLESMLRPKTSRDLPTSGPRNDLPQGLIRATRHDVVKPVVMPTDIAETVHQGTTRQAPQLNTNTTNPPLMAARNPVPPAVPIEQLPSPGQQPNISVRDGPPQQLPPAPVTRMTARVPDDRTPLNSDRPAEGAEPAAIKTQRQASRITTVPTGRPDQLLGPINRETSDRNNPAPSRSQVAAPPLPDAARETPVQRSQNSVQPQTNLPLQSVTVTDIGTRQTPPATSESQVPQRMAALATPTMPTMPTIHTSKTDERQPIVGGRQRSTANQQKPAAEQSHKPSTRHPMANAGAQGSNAGAPLSNVSADPTAVRLPLPSDGPAGPVRPVGATAETLARERPDRPEMRPAPMADLRRVRDRSTFDKPIPVHNASIRLPVPVELPSGRSGPAVAGVVPVTAGQVNPLSPQPAIQAAMPVSAVLSAAVGNEIVRRASVGHNRFEIRLDPPELGRVDVRMKISDDGTVRAHLVVERAETLDLFTRDRSGLERVLEQAGYRAEDGGLQFSLKQQSAGQEDRLGNQADRQNTSPEEQESEPEDDNPSGTQTPTAGSDRLDIRI